MAGFIRCKQSNCPVSKDGNCLEGIDDPGTNCTHFYLDEKLNGDENDDTSESVWNEVDNNKPKKVKLFLGDEITIGNLSEITYRYNCDKIFILGDHESGKTTILSTLFEMFQLGPFHNHFFAGSMTLIGFEKRCFHSRIASQNSKAEMERTKLEEFTFLHLALKKDPHARKTIHYLLSDISGEKITRAKDRSEEMKDLSIVKQASHVSYLIDGRKLSKKEEMFKTITQARSFIRKALDEGIFNENTRLSVVISKWDLLEGDSNFNAEEHIFNPFFKSFGDRVKELKFLKIAMRSENKDINIGYGLPELLDCWSPIHNKPKHTLPNTCPSNRMIDKLMVYDN